MWWTAREARAVASRRPCPGPPATSPSCAPPHVTPLLPASMLARLPFGLHALALVLYLAEARDSYAVAGLVDGAFGLGAARSASPCRAG